MLLVSLLMLGLVSLTLGDQFDKPESEYVSPCTAGHMEHNGECVPCARGLYLDPNTAKCVVCPLNSYSKGPSNSGCETCPNGFKTVDVGSQSREHCVYDVCEIPSTTLSYYQTWDSTMVLDAGRRVGAGTDVVITCTDIDNYVVDTEYNYLKFTCIRGLELPSHCVLSARNEQEQALKCYDKCYQERKGTNTRFLLMEGNTNKVVEACPLVSCQSSTYFDMCVGVSYKDAFTATTRVHYFCENSDTQDDELCAISGVDKSDDCKVTRCTTNGCNKPVPIKSGSAALNYSTLLIVIVISFSGIVGS